MYKNPSLLHFVIHLFSPDQTGKAERNDMIRRFPVHQESRRTPYSISSYPHIYIWLIIDSIYNYSGDIVQSTPQDAAFAINNTSCVVDMLGLFALLQLAGCWQGYQSP